ncbi:MAG TPA: bifunctional proline dehydrogenase/L-glutamate gamma-semialdehyde dehydrogenase PutA, partial [Geminicoccaceae bacterium]|nr:bifunctional proline dehydrogenase/L-glutamate gamma-semialdehyde dehydrogenase PutA [Geminicoccaceae bacterium]
MAARILEDRPPLGEGPLRAAIRRAQRTDEAYAVARLLEEAAVDPAQRPRIEARALRLAERVRDAGGDQLGVEAFLHEYSLSTREGVMLMCLAEALLRIPDPETSDRLIRDKLSFGDWARHLGHSDSLFVNASTWGLMLTGRFVRVDLDQDGEVGTRFGRLVQRLGEPVVRQAVLQAMRVLGRHFVLGQTIEGAIRRAREPEQEGYRYSYDMLGEAARTEVDAERYQHAYRDAIAAIVEAARGADLMARPGISIKLSALHPRYELAKHRRLETELLPRVLALLAQARAGNIAVTVDAEESERLEPSLDLFARLAAAPELAGWDGLGLAVQAYQKRAVHVVAWLGELARRARRRIPVRLVKGAYWDSEIKRAQEHGLAQYPVFTRKLATDVSYLACARRLLAGGESFYPQFATHNAQTLAGIVELAGPRRDFEFQRLHGMGEALYQGLRSEAPDIPCRVYAPVGSHQELLPYLVRRLLENGANTSFVNRILDPAIPLASLVGDPAVQLARIEPKANPKIPLPPALYGARRRNSLGVDLADPEELARLAERIAADLAPGLVARPGVEAGAGSPRPVLDPADRSRALGSVVEA